MNSDDYALAVIREGQRRGITARGIQIALATVIVESGYPIKMWANSKVPESLTLPHDAVGSDGYSVGLFQQQVVMSSMGWWWGDCATCMDPTKSAGLFYGRLANLDYNNTSRSPGSYAQQIQQSAFPSRYDQRFAEAVTLYNRLVQEASVPAQPAVDYGITKVMHGFNPNTPANATGNSNGPRKQTNYIAVHTQQAKSTAVNLATFCNNSRITQPNNPVSYNLVVDDKDTIEIVPVNEGPWSAGDANSIAVHICFAGSFAEWNAGKWLETDASDGLNEDAMLTRGAKAAAAACKQYGIPAIYAGNGGKGGWANSWPVLPKGIVGHRDFGRRGGGHTDPGDGFPMDEFLRRVNQFLNADNPTPPPAETGGPLMALSDDEQRELLDGVRWIKDQLGPNIWGPDSSLGKNDKGQELTLRDGLAAHIRKAGN